MVEVANNRGGGGAEERKEEEREDLKQQDRPKRKLVGRASSEADKLVPRAQRAE